jgi:hypothetical protein
MNGIEQRREQEYRQRQEQQIQHEKALERSQRQKTYRGPSLG